MDTILDIRHLLRSARLNRSVSASHRAARDVYLAMCIMMVGPRYCGKSGSAGSMNAVMMIDQAITPEL
jgi:hypothetical protein